MIGDFLTEYLFIFLKNRYVQLFTIVLTFKRNSILTKVITFILIKKQKILIYKMEEDIFIQENRIFSRQWKKEDIIKIIKFKENYKELSLNNENDIYDVEDDKK